MNQMRYLESNSEAELLRKVNWESLKSATVNNKSNEHQ